MPAAAAMPAGAGLPVPAAGFDSASFPPAAQASNGRRYGAVRLRLALGDLLGRAAGDDFAAAFAGLGADVDDVVGLGDEARWCSMTTTVCAFIDEAVEHFR